MRQGTYQVKIRQIGDQYVATGCVRAGSFEVIARAKVSVKAIQRMLVRAMQGWAGKIGYDFDSEIGWNPFKAVVKFVKKAVKVVKKVAKKIAQSKVLGKIAKTFRNPAFMAAVSVIPGIGPIAAGGLAAAGAAYGGLKAMTAKRKGKGRTARRISLSSARRAKKFGLSPARFNAAQRHGASLATDPKLIRKLMKMLALRLIFLKRKKRKEQRKLQRRKALRRRFLVMRKIRRQKIRRLKALRAAYG